MTDGMKFVDVEEWTNGWCYSQEGILHVDGSESCIGCGYKFPPNGGSFVVEVDRPEPPKGFPFNMQTCPLCKLRNRNQVLEKRLQKVDENRGDVLTRRLEALARARGEKA